MSMSTIVLATHNAHKVAELRRILAEHLHGIEVLGYDGPEPVEDGLSFAENALIKARAAAAHTGLPAIADDSGICVDILGGSPGIFSARWAGPARDSGANLRLLLWQLSDVPDGARAGHFECAAAVVIPESGFEHVSSGIWPGTILRAETGRGGFGYDPIFSPDGHTGSAAEMSADAKNAVSHRALAFEGLIPVLQGALAGS